MEKLNYYSQKNIHVLIPVKASSRRCPGKSKELLPYTQKWIEQVGLKDITTFIIDDLGEFEEELYGWDYWWEGKTSGDDILSLASYPLLSRSEFIFYFPVTQPFRDLDLAERMISSFEDNPGLDFITTYSIIQDRSIFFLNPNLDSFLNPSCPERKGSICPMREMIDGSGYLIKTEFLGNISKDKYLSNSEFWAGNFKAVENKSFLVDIDTEKDLELFRRLTI